MVGDAQLVDLAGGRPFDAVYSRFGVMFFADPVAAFANIAAAVRPGGRLTFVCWQSEDVNDWIAIPGRIMRSYVADLQLPPPDAPGPFAFQDAARVEEILLAAGWENPSVTPFSARAVMGGGDGVEAAVEHAMATRVALQLREQLDDDTFAEARAAVGAALADHVDADGAVSFDGNVWIVTATRP
jgi:SAM-dependent methyltransferase